MICRPGEPHSCSEGRRRPQRPKCLCHLHHLGTGASIWQTHRDHSAPQWWAMANCPRKTNGWTFSLCLFTLILKHFHRTSQPAGHFGERQSLLRPVWTADLLPSRFHSLHPQRFRTGEEGGGFPVVSHLMPLSRSVRILLTKYKCAKGCHTCVPPAAGVCEEAAPQGHSEQPGLDAQLLSWLAVWTSGAAQSHQRATVPRRSQREHEWHQHPSRKGELQPGQKHTNKPWVQFLDVGA